MASAPEFSVGLTKSFVEMALYFQFTLSPFPNHSPINLLRSLCWGMILGFLTCDRRFVPNYIPVEIHEMTVSSQNFWYWIACFFIVRDFPPLLLSIFMVQNCALVLLGILKITNKVEKTIQVHLWNICRHDCGWIWSSYIIRVWQLFLCRFSYFTWSTVEDLKYAGLVYHHIRHYSVLQFPRFLEGPIHEIGLGICSI